MLWCCMIAIVHVICNTSYSREERGGHDVAGRGAVCQTFFVQKGRFTWWLGEKMDEDRQT